MTTRKTPVTKKATVKKSVKPDGYVPLAGARDVLTVEGKDPNKIYRWFNDLGQRLFLAQRAAWEFVSCDGLVIGQQRTGDASTVGSRASKVVDKTTGMKAYLMAIDKDLYNEVQEMKQDQITAQEETIRKTTGKESGHYGKFEFEKPV